MITIKNLSYNQYQHFYEENLNIYTTFLQSWSWGKFQESQGYHTIRIGLFSSNKLHLIAQVIKIYAKRGNFLLIPHGPIFNKKILNNKQTIGNYLSKLTEYLIQIAKKERFSFIRISPILENNFDNQKIFKDLGYKTAPIYLNAETTWVLNINQDENSLLSNMRKTTRYLIRKAIKEEIIVEKRTDLKAVDLFYNIYLETAKREKFVPFSYDYIKNEFQIFVKNNQAIFILAGLKDQPYTAGALIIFNRLTGFYHQGASIHTKQPITYLLQWHSILEAKKRGCQYYNFWGIYDPKSKRTPKSWQGLTLFKTGFGGQIVRYLPTQDLILSPSYYLTYFWETYLMWKRN